MPLSMVVFLVLSEKSHLDFYTLSLRNKRKDHSTINFLLTKVTETFPREPLDVSTTGQLPAKRILASGKSGPSFLHRQGKDDKNKPELCTLFFHIYHSSTLRRLSIRFFRAGGPLRAFASASENSQKSLEKAFARPRATFAEVCMLAGRSFSCTISVPACLGRFSADFPSPTCRLWEIDRYFSLVRCMYCAM